MAIDPRIIDVFCAEFGEEHRFNLTSQTTMDDIEPWDSSTFLNLVMALEEEFGVEFSDSEAAQMFQLGHIQRIVCNAQLDLPHDDVTHACVQIFNLRNAPTDQLKVIVLSGSSTREGFVDPSQGLDMLAKYAGIKNVGWYNISVSGLVVAETLQLIELLGHLDNAVVLIGWSPVILGGCGRAEFIRSARHQRFPFIAPQMDKLLGENGYKPSDDEVQPSIELRTWIERFLKGRELEQLHYEPYLYPKLARWENSRYGCEEDVLRFYNSSILNYDQSIVINTILFRKILDILAQGNVPHAFLNLTIHGDTLGYLEGLGNMVSRAQAVLSDFQKSHGVAFIDAVAEANIGNADFRDPAHIFMKREDYTRVAQRFALELLKSHSA